MPDLRLVLGIATHNSPGAIASVCMTRYEYDEEASQRLHMDVVHDV
jgi:hypothetical protein